MEHLHRINTFADIVAKALERHPARVAFAHDGRQLTYRQTADLLGRIMQVYADRGFRPDQGVAVLSTNRPEAWLASTAAVMLGGRYTALHPLGSLEDFTDTL